MRGKYSSALLLAVVFPASLAAQASGGRAAQADPRPPAAVGQAISVRQQPPIRVPRDSAGEFRPNVQLQMVVAPPAVRPGEQYAAPWLDQLGGPSNFGSIVRTTQLPGIPMRPEERTTFQIQERVYVLAPPDRPAMAGQQFLSFALGDVIEGLGQIVLPTGVFRVEQVGVSGEASVARMTQQFAPVRPTDRLIPFDSVVLRRVESLSPVSGGAVTTVIWARKDQVLPSLLSYVIVGASQSDGARLGDVFALVRPREQMYDGTWLPEKEIARASVVRVTSRGSTLIVIHQTEPAIRVGVTAKLAARTP